MMDFEEFKQQVVEQIKEHLPIEYADADVSITPVIKNNDTVQDSLQIKTGDERVSPSINLNESFREYQRTGDFDGELEKLAAIRMNADPHLDVDIESILDFDSIKDRIDCRLINIETNSEYLKDKPFKQIEDLALVYTVELGKNSDGIMNTVINDNLMSSWGISTEELEKVAMENLESSDTSRFNSMRDMLKNMMFPDMADDDPMMDAMLPPMDGPQMYVLTSDDKLYGAKYLADTNKLDEIAEKLGGDLVVIPSSVHECIILPNDGSMDRAVVEGMIHDVNSTQVPPKDILSDHAYCYDAQEHELMRADRYEERQAEKNMEHQTDRPLAMAVGEEKAAYEAKEAKETGAEKKGDHRERKSVKAQIAEKKDIIAKTAVEKANLVKNHNKEI